MDLFQAIQERRSIRKFTGDGIPRDDLLKIVDAGRLAASGNNRQPWAFVVVTEKATIEELKVAAAWMDRAGAIIAVTVDPTTRWWVEDGAAAVQNMLLASTALGYGACWLEGYTLRHEADFKQLLNIPEYLRLLTLVPVGVPAERPDKEKRSLEQVIHWDRW